MDYNKRIARTAGIWYLLMAVFYTYSMVYADSAFYVPGNTTATIGNIMASEGILRLGFLSCLAGHISFLFLVSTLYKLFKPVNCDLARLMVIFVIAGVSVAFLNKLNQLASILLLNGKGELSAFDATQIQALVMFFLQLHQNGNMMTLVFWGLWLLPLGLLVLQSDFIPKILGCLLIGACIAYLIDFSVFFITPEYFGVVKTSSSIFESVSEVAFILWLLIMGVKHKNLAASNTDTVVGVELH